MKGISFARFRFAALFVALGACLSGPLVAQTLDTFNPRPDSPVTALIAHSDGDVYLGGGFTVVDGVMRGRAARVVAGGAVDRAFAGEANDQVLCMVELADGSTLMGGKFTTVNGLARSRIAKINRDGTLSNQFTLIFNERINSLAVQVDGKVVVAGNFTEVGGIQHRGLARLNANGTLDTGFDPDALGIVYSAAVQADGKIVVGGTFQTIGGLARNRIARLETGGAVDPDFNPDSDGTVTSLAIQKDGKILMGGLFSQVGGVGAACVERLNADGTRDTGFAGYADDWVDTIVLQADGKILIGGEFNAVNGTARNYVARLNADGTLDSGYLPNPNGIVHGLALQADGKVLMGGGFNYFGNEYRPHLARLTNNTAATQTLTVTGTSQIDWVRGGSAPEVEQVRFEVSTPGNYFELQWNLVGYGTRVAGGWRLEDLTLPAHGNIRAIGRTAGGWFSGSSGQVLHTTTFGAGVQPSFEVRRDGVALSSGSTLDFGMVNPSGNNDIQLTAHSTTDAMIMGYRVDIVGPAAKDFSQTFYLSNQTISTFIEGVARFTPKAGGTRRATLRIWTNDLDPKPYELHLTGYADYHNYQVIANPNWNVLALLPQKDGGLIFGGGFTIAKGTSRNGIARIDASGNLDANFNPNVEGGAVYGATEQADGKIIIHGSFTTVGGVARNRIARLNADGTLDTGFNPGANEVVQVVHIQPDGKILVGGNFTNIAGTTKNYIARLNENGTLDTGFTAGTNAAVATMALQTDGKILVGGPFTVVNSVSRNTFVRLNVNGTLDTAFTPLANNTVFSLAVDSLGRIYAGGAFTSMGGYAFSRMARLNADGTPDFSFQCGVDDSVLSIALQSDGKVLFGGNFDTVNGLVRPAVARVQANGTLDPDFGPAVTAAHGVYGVTLDSAGNIIIGGNFSVPYTPYDYNLINLASFKNSVATAHTFASPVAGELHWTPGGSIPLLEQVSFELWNGSTWVSQGAATHSAGTWVRSGLTLPAATWVRATGRSTGGYYSGSGGRLSFIGTFGTALPDIMVMSPSNFFLSNGMGFYSFGNQQWLTAGGARSFTIRNEGTGPLTGLEVTVTGTHATDFHITQPPVTTLAGGASTTFTIGFAPLGGGTRSADIQIANSDFEKNPYSFNVSGVGVIPEDTFNPAIAGQVIYATALQADGSVMVGGNFSGAGGMIRSNLARVHADGTLDQSFFPVIQGGQSRVYSITMQPDGSILAGGDFTTAGGSPHQGLVKILTDGSVDETFTGTTNGSVNSILRLPSGQILIGGTFSMVNGVARSNLARLNANGTLDTSFTAATNGTVTVLALQSDDMIVLGGTFTTVNTVARNRIARLTAAGALDTGFNPNGGATVQSLAIQPDGKIVVAGAFTTIGGTTRNRIARINANGSLDTGFNPNANADVNTLALQANGQILIGGAFGTVGGVSRTRIAKLNADGTLDTTFNPNANNTVHSLSIQADGNIIVGGQFSNIASVNRSLVARIPNNIVATQDLAVTSASQLDWVRGGATPEVSSVTFESWDGTAWTSLGVGLRVAGGWRLAGLSLPSAGWVRARGISTGAFSAASQSLIEQRVSFGTVADPEISVEKGATVLASLGSTPIEFTQQDWLTESSPKVLTIRNDGAADLTGLAITTSGPYAADFIVSSLPATLLAPGDSTQIQVAFRPRGGGVRIAVLHIASNDPDEAPFSIPLKGSGLHRDTTFYPTVGNVSTSGNSVYSVLMLPEGRLLVGGNFSTFNGTSASNVAKANMDGSLAHGVSSSLGEIRNLALQADGKFLAGGNFSNPDSRIARFLPDGTLDTTFTAPSLSSGNQVTSVLPLPDGKVLVAGSMGSVHLKRLNANGTLDGTITFPLFNSSITTMFMQPDGKLVVAGSFTTVGGTARVRIARLNANGTLDAGFNSATVGNVNAIALQADGKILVASLNSVHRLNSDGTLDSMPPASFSVLPGHQSVELRSIAVQADGKILVGGNFTYVNGQVRKGLARLLPTGLLDPDFDPGVEGSVRSVSILPDGRIAVGGTMTQVGGVPRINLALLPNDSSATQSLTVTDTTQVDWQLGGTSPVVDQAWFERWDGTAWVDLGATTRVAGGWQKPGLSLPASAYIRARGRTTSGFFNGSAGFLGDMIRYGEGAYPVLVVEDAEGAELTHESTTHLGSASWPQVGTPVDITIRNTGTGPLTNLAFTEIVPVGGSADDFDFAFPAETSIAPGQSLTLQAQVTPSFTGTRKVTLSITSSDPTANPYLIHLTGTGSYSAGSPLTAAPGGVIQTTLEQRDGGMIISGLFSSVSGTPRSYLARITPGGTLDPAFNPSPNHYVHSIVEQSDGKLIIGGSFTSLGGISRSRIARLNPDGTLDSTVFPVINSTINCLTLQADGSVVIGGNFTSVGDTARNRMARLLPDGTLDSTFNPDVNSSVYGILLQAGGKIVLTGNFTTVGGVARTSLARVLSSGALDTTFVPPAITGTGHCLAPHPNGGILWGSYAGQVGGVSANGVARFSDTGTHDTTFNPFPDSGFYWMQSLAVQADGMILAGGSFTTTVNGIQYRNLARISPSGTLDSGFKPDPSSMVYSVALQANSDVVLGGQFNSITPSGSNYLSRLFNDTPATRSLFVTGTTAIQWVATGSAPALNYVTLDSWNGSDWVNHPATKSGTGTWSSTGLSLPASGWIRARGHVTSGQYNGSVRYLQEIIPYGPAGVPQIAVEGPDGDDLVSGATVAAGTGNYFTPGTPLDFTIRNDGTGPLSGLALQMAGSHSTDFTATSLGATTLAVGESTSFQVLFTPTGAGARTAQLQLTSSDATRTPFLVEINGTGVHDDGGPAPYSSSSATSILAMQPDGKTLIGGWSLQRITKEGVRDLGFNSAVSGVIGVALLADGKILVGGTFAISGGAPRNGLARLHSDGSLDTSFDAGLDNAVTALAVQPDGKILLGGSFTTVAGVPRLGMARLHADGTLDASFSADTDYGVSAIIVQGDGQVLVAGQFTMIGGQARNRIARLAVDGTPEAGFNPDANQSVITMALQPDGKILLAGNFTSLGGTARNHLARLETSGSLDTGFNPNPDGTVLTLAVQLDGAILVGGSFTSVGGIPRQRIARLSMAGVADPLFDPGANSVVYGLALDPEGTILVTGQFTNLGGLARSYFGRLANNLPATQVLQATGGTQLDWLRSGAGPVIEDVTFESWTGTDWISLGTATKVSGGWRRTGLILPTNTWVRALGRTRGGLYNGGSGLVSQMLELGTAPQPRWVVLDEANIVLPGTSASVDFGTINGLANPPLTRTFTLRNDGDTVLTGIDVALTGDSTFLLEPPAVTFLAPGAATSFTLSYDASTWGASTGGATITVHDPVNSAFTINLTGTASPLTPGFTTSVPGSVYSTVDLPSGGMLVGYQGRLARLLSDGSADPVLNQTLSYYTGGQYGFNVTGSAYCIALQKDGKAIVGGIFQNLGRTSILRLNPDGTVDSGFAPNFALTQITTISILKDGKILVGGTFSTIDGLARSALVRLHPNGNLDMDFNAALASGAQLYSMAIQEDGKIVIGGAFNNVGGVARQNLARLNADGTLDADFNVAANSTVLSVALQGGQILVAGHFSQLGGVARNRIGRLSATGVLDPDFDPNADAAINSLTAQSDGGLIVAGDFNIIAGQAQARIARLLPSGSLDTSFSPMLMSNSSVRSVMLTAGGEILVGGSFSQIYSFPVNNLVRIQNPTAPTQTLAPAGGSSIGWTVGGSFPEMEQVTLEYWDGSAWVAGTASRGLEGWSAAGLTLPASGWLRATGWIRGGYRSGTVTPYSHVSSYGTAPTPTLVVEDAEGAAFQSGVDTVSFGTQVHPAALLERTFTLRNEGAGPLSIQGVSMAGSAAYEFIPDTTGMATLLAPGEETAFSVRFEPVHMGSRLATLQISSSDLLANPFTIALTGTYLDNGFDTSANNTVRVMVPLPSGKSLVGGAFTVLDGLERNYLARINEDGEVDPTFNSIVNGQVGVITTLPDGKIIIGGSFTSVGGLARQGVARLLANGAVDPTFGNPGLQSVNAIHLEPDGKLIIGGYFTSVAGIGRTSLARLHSDGSVDLGYQPELNTNAIVYSIARQRDGRLLIGGSFTTVDGHARTGIARLLENGRFDPGFAPIFTPSGQKTIHNMALQSDGKVVISGDFTAVNSTNRTRMARLLPDGSLDPTFNTFVNGGSYYPSAMAVMADGRMLLGGDFTTVSGVNRSGLVRLLPDGSVDLDFFPVPNGKVNSLALREDGTLLIGGAFTQLNGASRNRIAHLRAEVPAVNTLELTGASGVTWVREGSAPEFTRVSFDLRDGTTWVTLGAGEPSGSGHWELTGLSLPESGEIRARGFAQAGEKNGSSYVAEQFFSYTPPPASVILLTGNGQEIAPGNVSPSLEDHTDFGSISAAGGIQSRTYTIWNSGTANLLLQGSPLIQIAGDHAGDFALSVSPNSPVNPGGNTEFSISFAPFASGLRSATVIITHNAPELPNPYSFAIQGEGLSPQQLFAIAIANTGLIEDDAELDATPFNDGVENLLKYAFNMNLAAPDSSTMLAGGNAGLPSISQTGTGEAGVLRFEFVRRIGSGLIYTPKKSTSLDAGDWIDLTGTPTIIPIDSNWERVIYEEPSNLADVPTCFGIVEIAIP